MEKLPLELSAEVTIAGVVRFKGDLMSLVDVDPSTLQTNHSNQARARLFVGSLKADAKEYMEVLDARLDTLKAQLFGEFKNGGGEKPPSDTTTDKMVKADPRVLKGAEELAKASGTYTLCCELCEAVDHRLESLSNLSANMRREEPGTTPAVPTQDGRPTRDALAAARAAREEKEQSRAAVEATNEHVVAPPPPEGLATPPEPEKAPPPPRRVPARK